MKKILMGLYILGCTLFSNYSNSQVLKGLNLSNNGYLIFNDRDELDALVSQIATKTHGQVREYFQEINFNSFGSIKFSEVSSSSIISESEASFYVLNSHVVMQVEGIVMKIGDETKGTDEWSFLITTMANNLNEEILEKLNAGNFNEEFMNKFALGEEINQGIFEFTKSTPSGYNYTGEPIVKAEKFWGVSEIRDCTSALLTNTCQVCKRKYRFWIAWGDKYDCHFVNV